MTDQTSPGSGSEVDLGTSVLPPDDERHEHLAIAELLLVSLSRRPHWVLYTCIGIVSLLSWIWLGLMVTAASAEIGARSLGPGVADLLGALGVPQSDFLLTIGQICFPTRHGILTWPIFATSLLMWMSMSLAMMLPSAAPMMRTYGDIANVAKRDGKPVVSTVTLAAGYMLVWLTFSLLATLLQLFLVHANPSETLHYPIQGLLGGAILIGAGLYQFSALKDQCLEKCRNPFNILFAKWADTPAAIFRLGIEQGLFCLGCCWALMLVMLVVGTMNLAWMAFFTLFAILEKSGTGKVTSVVSGCILIAWGVSLITGIAALT